MFRSPCAAFTALDTDNNAKADGSGRPPMVANLCFAVLDPKATTTTTSSSSSNSNTASKMPIDLTTYETAIYRNMDDSRVFHKSPTNEEITAAQKASATPSIPIDHDRYLTFAYAVGGEWTMQYPNLFRFDEKVLIEKYSKTGILKRGPGGEVIQPEVSNTGVLQKLATTTL